MAQWPKEPTFKQIEDLSKKSKIAHIWLGEDDLYNDRHDRTDGVRTTEIVCNAVAGELLVPKQAFFINGMKK